MMNAVKTGNQTNVSFFKVIVQLKYEFQEYIPSEVEDTSDVDVFPCLYIPREIEKKSTGNTKNSQLYYPKTINVQTQQIPAVNTKNIIKPNPRYIQLNLQSLVRNTRDKHLADRPANPCSLLPFLGSIYLSALFRYYPSEHIHKEKDENI